MGVRVMGVPCYEAGDEIPTDLRANSVRLCDTQSFINGDWVRPGLREVFVVRAHACLPGSHPLYAG